MRLYCLILLVGLPFFSLSQGFDYDLKNPVEIVELPDTLREVSGITDLDGFTIACVQDERGIIFIYDVQKKEVVHQYRFNMDGDYEGITRVKDTLYVLRSDGLLFGIQDYKSKRFKIVSYDTGIPAPNNEGLCFDPVSNQLLIASKGKSGKGPEFKNKRVVYGFDLNTRKTTPAPVYEFDTEKMKAYADRNKIQLPKRTLNKKGTIVQEPVLKMNTSAIAIHPVTKMLCVLSASDQMFFVFDRKGDLIYLELLDPKKFNKPEGITFFANNELLITNEGQKGKPTLLRFGQQQ